MHTETVLYLVLASSKRKEVELKAHHLHPNFAILPADRAPTDRSQDHPFGVAMTYDILFCYCLVSISFDPIHTFLLQDHSCIYTSWHPSSRKDRISKDSWYVHVCIHNTGFRTDSCVAKATDTILVLIQYCTPNLLIPVFTPITQIHNSRFVSLL